VLAVHAPARLRILTVVVLVVGISASCGGMILESQACHLDLHCIAAGDEIRAHDALA